TLTQSLPQKREEEKELDQKLWRTAEQIHNEIPLVLQLAQKSPDEIKKRIEELRRVFVEAKDSSGLKEREAEFRILLDLENSTGNLTIARFLRNLSVDDIAGIMRAGRMEFAWPEEPNKRPIPADTRDEIKRIVLAQNIKYNNPNRDFNFATICFDAGSSLRP